MGLFNRKQAEERVGEDWRLIPWSEKENKSNHGNLRCKEATTKDKKSFGRSKSMKVCIQLFTISLDFNRN